MTTTYRILTIGFLITVFGCNNNNNNNTDSKKTAKTENETVCKPYFDFNEVEHYYLDIDEDKIWEIEEKTQKTEKEEKQLELL
ncbi:MAG: hypothetical protein KGZ81_08795, partial [Flavobacteriales bacterium]|nr:hypothetical protein [Flavobacteriales bacterium]